MFLDPGKTTSNLLAYPKKSFEKDTDPDSEESAPLPPADQDADSDFALQEYGPEPEDYCNYHHEGSSHPPSYSTSNQSNYIDQVLRMFYQ